MEAQVSTIARLEKQAESSKAHHRQAEEHAKDLSKSVQQGEEEVARLRTEVVKLEQEKASLVYNRRHTQKETLVGIEADEERQAVTRISQERMEEVLGALRL